MYRKGKAWGNLGSLTLSHKYSPILGHTWMGTALSAFPRQTVGPVMRAEGSIWRMNGILVSGA